MNDSEELENSSQNITIKECIFQGYFILRLCFTQVYWRFYQNIVEYFKEKFATKDNMTLQHMAQYNENCDWIKTPIRCIIFNPDGPELATLSGDDAVTLFPDRNTKSFHLKYYKQIHTSCGAFRPGTRNELAVGGASGICLWQQPDLMKRPQPMWIGLKKEDFVMNLQWLENGHHLACALLYACCIQLWQPDSGQVLHEIQLLHPESFLWLLSYKPDIVELFNYLNNNEKDNCKYNFSDIEPKINGTEIIQSACWTAEGNLVFVVRQCCKVFCYIPYVERGIFVKPFDKWSIETPLDLSSIELNEEHYSFGEPQALSIDPCNIYVAILFKRQQHILICLHAAPFGDSVRLTPFNIIDCQSSSDIYPTFITFSFDDYREKKKRSMFIGWSSGNVQQLPLSDNTAKEASEISHDNTTQFMYQSNGQTC